MIRTTLTLLGMLLLANTASAAEQAARTDLSSKGQLLDRVAAIVNDDVVTVGELEEQMGIIAQRLQEQNTPLPAPEVLRKQVLDRLIVQEVQMQRARKVGRAVAVQRQQVVDDRVRRPVGILRLHHHAVAGARRIGRGV